MQIQVTARSKTWVCGCSLAEFAGLNPPPPAGAWLSMLIVVCYQVEVSVTRWSLIQSSPTECGVTECDREASIMRRPRPNGGCRATGMGLVMLPLTQFNKIQCILTTLMLPYAYDSKVPFEVVLAVLLGFQALGYRAVVPSSSRILRNVGNHSPNDNVTSLKTRILIQFQFTTQSVWFWQSSSCIVRFCLKFFQSNQQFYFVSSPIVLLALDSHSQLGKDSDVLTVTLPILIIKPTRCTKFSNLFLE